CFDTEDHRSSLCVFLGVVQTQSADDTCLSACHVCKTNLTCLSPPYLGQARSLPPHTHTHTHTHTHARYLYMQVCFGTMTETRAVLASAMQNKCPARSLLITLSISSTGHRMLSGVPVPERGPLRSARSGGGVCRKH